MKPPTFSVVIPTLNEEKFLPKLLESLTKQTIKDFEVIIVDGQSKDKTIVVAKTYMKKIPKLQVIRAPHASLPYQRNMGAQNAKGTWLGFIDADSVLLPYFFERADEYIDTYHPEFFTTWCRPDTEKTGEAMLALIGNIIFEASVMVKKSAAPGPLTFVTRRIFDMIGGYDEDHAYNEDMDFGMRLHKKGIPMHIIKESLYVLSFRRYRQQGMLKVMQQAIRSALPVLFFNTTLKKMPDYIMGGQLYNTKKAPKRSVLKRYEYKFKELMKEIFEDH